MKQQPISILLCALGGEGGGVLTEWLIDAARHAGYAAQSTSIPGVAQRTGATTYYLEVFPVPVAQLQGRKPVFSLNPLPGTLDALVSSELLETARQVGNGMSAKGRTLVLTSNARSLTVAERMELGDGRADDAKLLELISAHCRAHHVLDMAGLARASGTVVSAVMLGVLAASGVLPFPRESYEAAIRGDEATPINSTQASLRGFTAALDAVTQLRQQEAFVAQVLAEPTPPASPATRTLHPSIAALPSALHTIVGLGYERVVEYQNEAYGALYLQRVEQIRAAEASPDLTYPATVEAARWLALWMAFDDIVRVADLKSRASRASRVISEVKAGEQDIVKVFDHFKPGVPEFAAMLPLGVAQRLLRWDARRSAQGKAPWALPLKIGSHSVFGMIALRVLAKQKWLRAQGSRFALEQQLIDGWTAALVAGLEASPALGLELAQCGRLIKGYGSTNERGKEALLHITEHVVLASTSVEARTAAIKAAREAALKDAGGVALDEALRVHGAPPRVVKAQPIRWMKKPVRV